MSNRATVRYVHEHVYCSSTMHYAADVTLERNGKLAYYMYDFNGSLLRLGKRGYTERPCPKYLEAAILAKLRDAYIQGVVKVYEHDRDGNRRYDGLRYHERGHFENLIGVNAHDQQTHT
jgi:hypothetical protein